LLVWWYAGTGVEYLDQDATSFRRHAQAHRREAVRERIVQQVGKEPLDEQ